MIVLVIIIIAIIVLIALIKSQKSDDVSQEKPGENAISGEPVEWETNKQAIKRKTTIDISINKIN